MQELLDERLKLELSMRNGFLELAKSRHSMGSRAVCSLQLPSSTSEKCYEANYKVDRCLTERNGVETLSFYQQQTPSEETNEQNDGLRKRTQNKDSNKELKVVKTNSLRWFGILLPNSLKVGQQQFESSLNSAGKVASLQILLQKLLDEYKKLKEQ
ncbi:hypothetical protein CHUAL_001362 [Chamberlinius hualienensis]